jgi:hypothetical protein
MQNQSRIYFYLFLFFVLLSCGGEPTYNKFEIASLIKQADENAEIIYEEFKGLDCRIYGDQCIEVYRAKVIDYEIVFVELVNVENAKNLAKKKKTLYLRNWIIENIKDEPPLMNFFRDKIKASSP